MDINNDEKQITFWTPDGEQSVPIGFNSMLKSEMVMAGMGKVVTATSGAWTGDHSYQITMYIYDSPHAITYNFRFDGDEVIVHPAFNVFFGPTEQPQMRGKKE